MTLTTTHITRWLLMLGLCLSVSSCSSLIYDEVDDAEPEPVPTIDGLKLQLYLDVPASRATGEDDLTYDDPQNQEGADNVLVASDIDVIFYTTDHRYVTHVTGKQNIDLSLENPPAGQQHPTYHRYLAQMQVDGLSNNTEYRVVVLANKRTSDANWYPFTVKDVIYKAPAGSSMTDEEYLYMNGAMMGNPGGTHYFGNRVAEYTRWNLAGVEGAGVPMWGMQKMTIKVVNKENLAALEFSNPDQPINMMRAIAKVRIELGEELKQHVEVTPYQQGNAQTGCVLNYKHAVGYLAPTYSWASAFNNVPSNLYLDRVGGSSDGAFTNQYVHAFADATKDEIGHAPFYKTENGEYYIYLYEHNIGEASIGLQFHWTAEALQVTPVYHNYTLHFADYAAATQAAINKVGAANWKERPLTEEELEGYKFPVMRNHYYTYTITKLNPLELKFEVCEWVQKQTEIIFN